jgi:mono/diheme cytochrome c family protein
MIRTTKSRSRDSLDGAATHRAPRTRMIAVLGAIAFGVAIAAAAFMFVDPSAAAQSAAAKSNSEESAAADVERGKKLFTSYGCYECHGRAAQGGVGPRLGPAPLPLSFIEKYVRHPTGSMPPYTDKTVSDQDLSDIYAYLKSLHEPPNEKNIPLLNQ